MNAILVVDDAEDCIATLDLALQTLPGIVIRAQPSAEAALAFLEHDRVSAVITDIHLPEMTGLELVARIREDPVSVRCPSWWLAPISTDLTASVASWLQADHDNLTGKVLRHPDREEIDTPVQEQLIVELYSK